MSGTDGLDSVASSQPQGLKILCTLRSYESAHDILWLVCFLIIPNLRLLQSTSRVPFLIFVLRCSYVTRKQSDPSGLCFYNLLGGARAVPSLGLIIYLC